MDESSELLAKTLMSLGAINNQISEDYRTEKYLRESAEVKLKRIEEESSKYRSDYLKMSSMLGERDLTIKKLHTDIEVLKQKLALKDKRRKKK